MGRVASMAVLLAGLTVLAGCGGRTHREKHFARADGQAVIQDAYDGHLNHAWSCGSLRAAYDRLPQDGVALTLPPLIGRAAAEACDAALTTIQTGMPASGVRVALGEPDTGGRCSVFRWPPADAGQSVLGSPSSRRSPIDGARVCFNNRLVSLLQTSVHG